MRVSEMPSLCCISLESPAIDGQSPNDYSITGADFPADLAMPSARSEGAAIGSEIRSVVSVAGVLYKWTNYGKGWRSRWFLLRNGIISYSKSRRSDCLSSTDDVRVIGNDSRLKWSGSRRKQQKAVGVVHLKILSFRESKSDEKRFYIFTGTKTLHLRTASTKDRVAWIEALASARTLLSLKPLSDSLSLFRNGISVSTGRLRDRLVEVGLDEAVIQDCEHIMLSEFSDLKGRLDLFFEERLNLVDTLRQLEATSAEADLTEIQEDQMQSRHEKDSECSTTESSDDIEKQELGEPSDEDEVFFFDTKEYFSDSANNRDPVATDKRLKTNGHVDNPERLLAKIHVDSNRYSHFERRKKLPEPAEKEKGVSLWSMIKDNVGKDLTRVCLPVYFNEPLSSLQKCFEDMEYSYLLDKAYEYGKTGNGVMRALHVAAFAVSGYASSDGRHCKPFNPLLGETYEADYPEMGIRFFSEKVSHHPMIIACHCEGRGWKFWGESNIRSKFWGRSIELDPVGVLTLEFDDGELFQWSKVTTTIYNLILGRIYCDHHGTMRICGNRRYSGKLKFKEQSILDRNPHQVYGSIEDAVGNKVATLMGKWNDSIYYSLGDWTGKSRCLSQLSEATLLWKRSKPPKDPSRYNLSQFAITLNELAPGLKDKLPPTDSRLRPDQRCLENGEFEKADAEKLRLERRQRMSRKLQEDGWKPKWFRQDGNDGSYQYSGGYWEAREENKWDMCPSIFVDFF